MATSRQLWALYLASGKAHDYRNDNLSKEQASALLEEFNTKNGYKKESARNESKPKKNATSKAPKESKPNKFGVKVGDIFHMSWGYDQTNNDFFQVVELVGESSVRIREVGLNLISEKCGFMCADQLFEVPQNGEMAGRIERSIWIKDQECGDVKRVFDGGAPYVKIGHHHATKCSGKTVSVYESWYA